MSSTFFGLTISASGLNTAQAQINTTANNISNVQTNGYSKQIVNTVASSALRCYQSYGTTGTGVEAVSVTQCRDLYYDEKYWNNQSEVGFYDKKMYYMEQLQSYFSETGSTTGFSTIYAKMFNAMSTLQGNAGDNTVRKQFIADAKELMTYFNGINTKLKQLQSSVNDEIKTAVDEVNAIAEKIAILNKQINVIEQGNTKACANELRDQRALLIDELSEYVTTDTKEVPIVNSNYPDMPTGATYYTVYINGQLLVDNYEFNTLGVKARAHEEAYNQCDVEGLYDIVWAEDGNGFNPVNSVNSGSIKSMFEMRDGNNCENMKGKVVSSTSDSITITNVSDNLINELNIASTGAFYVNNTEYMYKDFSITTNADGNIDTITFNLVDGVGLSDDECSKLANKELVCGKSVDFMGIAYYQNQMSIFLRNFCEAFNTIEESGVDANGDPMSAFFVAKDIATGDELTMTDDKKSSTLTAGGNFYYRLTAESAAIAYRTDKDSSLFAVTTKENYSSGQDAADLVVQLQRLQSKEVIFRGGGGDSFLQCMYADITVDTQECEVFSENYANIKITINKQRMSVSGVDEDEEALDLIKFQNAYNLSSKCISVFTEIYDRLILETGV